MKTLMAVAICLTGGLLYGFVIFPYITQLIGLIPSLILGIPYTVVLGQIAEIATRN